MPRENSGLGLGFSFNTGGFADMLRRKEEADRLAEEEALKAEAEAELLLLELPDTTDFIKQDPEPELVSFVEPDTKPVLTTDPFIQPKPEPVTYPDPVIVPDLVIVPDPVIVPYPVTYPDPVIVPDAMQRPADPGRSFFKDNLPLIVGAGTLLLALFRKK